MNPEPYSSHDVAWAAGFMDGEGTFTLLEHGTSATHPSQRAVHVGATQTTREPLEKLASIFGGKVGPLGITSAGNQAWQWRIGEARAVEAAITQLLPYLVVKQRDAEIVLEFASTIRRRGRTKKGIADHIDAAEVAIRERLIGELAVLRGKA